MERFCSQADLEKAIHALIAIEPRFAPIHQQHGTPSLRSADPSLETLLHIVTEQFLSLKAADAIWQRLAARLHPVSRETVLARAIDELMSLGLSRSKAKCFHACAAEAVDFRNADSAVLRRELLAIWGIGPWTADIFLLSAAGHSDAWPCGDVALQAAAQHLFRLRQRPNPAKLEKLSLKWRPYRAAAARLLWSHYRGLKSMQQAPSQT